MSKTQRNPTRRTVFWDLPKGRGFTIIELLVVIANRHSGGDVLARAIEGEGAGPRLRPRLPIGFGGRRQTRSGRIEWI